MKRILLLLTLCTGCATTEPRGQWESDLEAKAKVPAAKLHEPEIEVTVSLKRKW